MRHNSIIFLLTFCLLGLLSLPVAADDNRLAGLFNKHTIDGTIIISNLDGSRRYVHNEQRVKTSFLPASTFKILNTLIALDEGVIAEKAILRWDGTQYEFAAWNRDQTLESAFKSSCVWFYQELARRIGREKYQEWLKKTGYGNLQAGPDLTTFWLDGDLRISAEEQVEFLKKVYLRKLPFKASSYDLLNKVMLVESTSGYSVWGKTGWAARTAPQIGWYVGYIVVKDGSPWFFALNMTIATKNDLTLRQQLVLESLRSVGLLP